MHALFYRLRWLIIRIDHSEHRWCNPHVMNHQKKLIQPTIRMWHNHCQADLTATNRSRYYHALSLANYLTVSHSPLVCLSTPRVRFRDHFHILIIYHITLLVDIFRTAERFNCFHSPKFIWPPSAQWKEIYWTLVINFRIREEMCNKSSDGELFWSIIIHVELMLQTKKKQY